MNRLDAGKIAREDVGLLGQFYAQNELDKLKKSNLNLNFMHLPTIVAAIVGNFNSEGPTKRLKNDWRHKYMHLTTTNNLEVSQITESCQTKGSLPIGNEFANPLTSWDDLPLCFGVETLAFIMGCSMGKARDICKNGGICCFKEGKRYVIFKQDLLDWLEQRRRNLKRVKTA